MPKHLKTINIATIGFIDHTPSAIDQGREGRKGEEAMSDTMSNEQDIKTLEGLIEVIDGPNKMFDAEARINAIRRAIAALTAKSDAELIAWGLMNAALNRADGGNRLQIWLKGTKDGLEWEAVYPNEYVAPFIPVCSGLIDDKEHLQVTPEARAILAAAKREADGKKREGANG